MKHSFKSFSLFRSIPWGIKLLINVKYILRSSRFQNFIVQCPLSRWKCFPVRFIDEPWLKSHHCGVRWWYVICHHAKKNPVIYILGKSFLIVIANYEWLKHTTQPLVLSLFCDKNLHGICFNPVALGLPFNTTYVNTYILIFFHHRWMQSQIKKFKLHDRNYSVRFHNCAHCRWHPEKLTSKHSRQPFWNSLPMTYQ